jgi:hypothetical protein
MIKSQRFWSKELRKKVEDANFAIKTRNRTELERIVDELVVFLKNELADWKDRVAICFILEQIAAIDPISAKIIEALKAVLNDEKDPHVREFAVWALGKIVEERHTLDLIKETLPVIVHFLSDDSEQVKRLAEEYHSRLTEYLREQEGASKQINEYREQLLSLVEQKLAQMKAEGDAISKDALGLNYQTAFEKQQEMKKRIQDYNAHNQILEDELQAEKQKIVDKFPEFQSVGDEILRHWRTQRGEKEDLIRRVDCILRIQSKIFTIIRFIISRTPDGKIDLDELKSLTALTGRPYSEKEIVEILQQLVDEEIVPTFMLDQIKDYQIKTPPESPDKNQAEKPQKKSTAKKT